MIDPPQTILTSPPIFMFTAPNPSPKTLSGTHTYLVGRNQAYAIDPGPAIEAYQDALAGWVGNNGVEVRGILLTHGHPDHAPGAARLKQRLSVPVWASRLMPASAADSVDRYFDATTSFEVDEDRLEVIETPGHTAEHVAFWLPGARVLFAGDTILGQGSALVAPPEGDMAHYMRSLESMRRLGPALIAPGHGPLVRQAAEKIAEYVAHRREREAQLLAALAEGPCDVEELVRRVYADVNPALRRLAAASVLAQLLKLQSEGKVARSSEGWALFVGR